MNAKARPDQPATRTAKASAKSRTPNAERSAATRAKILNAAIDCLVEVGYHQTSTVLVTEKAGVSRGAMLHHFPSKAELILETFAHIRTLRTQAHSGVLDPIKSDRDKFLALIDALWTTVQTKAGIARIEIMMGARCDPEVGPKFGELHHFFIAKHRDRVHTIAQSLGIRDHKKLDAFVTLYMATMRGLIVESFYDEPRTAGDIKSAVAMLKDFQVTMLDRMLAEKKS